MFDQKKPKGWEEMPHIHYRAPLIKPESVVADYTVHTYWDVEELEEEYEFDWFNVEKWYIRWSDLHVQLKCGRVIEIPATYDNWLDPKEFAEEPVSVRFQ